MIPLQKANVVRLKKNQNIYEILANIEEILRLRNKLRLNKITKEEIITNLDDVIADSNIYKDAKKGLIAEGDYILKEKDNLFFEIITKGEFQLPAEIKKKIFENKKNEIIDIIRTNSIDPNTKLPHPRDRIIRAMQQAKVCINEHKGAQEQANEIIKKLRLIIPISYGLVKLTIHIPKEHANSAYSLITKECEKLTEQWLKDGSYYAIINIPIGLKNDFISKISSITHGCLEYNEER